MKETQEICHFHLEKLHTTEMGQARIKKNLGLEVVDVVEWCQEQLSTKKVQISRKGKNWYVELDDCIITINVYSNTIITAHKKGRD